jgi:hypothetical protein
MYIFSHILLEFSPPHKQFQEQNHQNSKRYYLYGVLDIVCSYSVRLSAILPQKNYKLTNIEIGIK